VLRVERALRAEEVWEWLQRVLAENGARKYLRRDNG
jgi:hypothetical protein